MSQNKHDDGLKTYAIGMTVVLGIVVCTEIVALTANVVSGAALDRTEQNMDKNKIYNNVLREHQGVVDSLNYEIARRDSIIHSMQEKVK